VRTGGNLSQRISLDPTEVAVLHLFSQQLAAGRVDALADHHERPIEADRDLSRRRTKRCVRHE
jgi:hypothetical protein